MKEGDTVRLSADEFGRQLRTRKMGRWTITDEELYDLVVGCKVDRLGKGDAQGTVELIPCVKRAGSPTRIRVPVNQLVYA